MGEPRVWVKRSPLKPQMEVQGARGGVGVDKAIERNKGAQGGVSEKVALCTPRPPPTRVFYWLVSFTKIQARSLSGGRSAFPEGTERGG